MGKGSSDHAMVGLVNGSMAVAKKAAKVKNITRKRHFLQSSAQVDISQQVLSATQSPFPVGSQFSAGTLLFSASKLTQNAREWVQNFDKYRICEIEVFCTLNSRSKTGSIDQTAPVEIFFYEDTDADPTTQTSWLRTADRTNVGRVVLNAFNPSARLVTFTPTITLAASVIDQNPSNIVPKKDTWLDALSLQQLYSGLRYFSACPTTDAQGQSYDYTLSFQVRYSVECMQPI